MKKLVLKTIAASMLFAAGTTVYAKDVKIGVSFQNAERFIVMSDALRAKAKTLAFRSSKSDGQGKGGKPGVGGRRTSSPEVDAIVLNPYDKGRLRAGRRRPFAHIPIVVVNARVVNLDKANAYVGSG